MPVYHPRATCLLHIPPLGGTQDAETIALPVRPRSVTVEYNDHNHADTATVTAEWRDVGVDPRFLKNATCEIWIGNADDRGIFVPSAKSLRFIGVMTRPRRVAKEGNGFEVTLEFHDYTELFLSAKPFPTKGVPTLADTLLSAWQKICDHTGPLDANGKTLSSVSVLRDRLEFRGDVNAQTLLGRAVSSRFAKLTGQVPTKQKSDAWAVWQQCVGMVGLISYIERDRCVVTTSTEHFDSDESPKLVWGRDILELEEETNAKFSDKGVALVSFDPLTGTTLEAYHPPPNDVRIKRKRVVAKKRGQKAAAIESDRYDHYEYHGVTDPDVLAALARRAWEERSLQEIGGRLRTAEMRVTTQAAERLSRPARGAPTFDLLELRAGDNIRIEIDPIDKETLKSLGSNSKRRDYLIDRGYRPEVADVIVRNMSVLDKLDPTFHATRVQMTLEASDDAGKFEVEVEFHNRIQLSA